MKTEQSSILFLQKKEVFCNCVPECVLLVETCVEEPGVGYDEVYIFVRGD